MEATIAIIGAGKIGGALARRFADAGHIIRFGVRDPDKDYSQILADTGKKASVVAVPDAVRDAEIVVLSVPGGSALEAARSAGELSGKIVVDCANPIKWDGGPVWSPPEEGSLTAALQSQHPSAKCLKAWNAFGVEFHKDPQLSDGPVDVLIAGDDAQAKRVINTLAEESGFQPVDAGPLRNAAVLENMAVMWIHLAMVGGQGRDFAFRLARRS